MTSIFDLATDREREYLEAVEQYGSQRRAAKALGINKRTLERGVANLKRKAASRGYAPEHDMTRPAAPGFKISGQWTKVNVGKDGSEQVYQKSIYQTRDAEQFDEMLRDLVSAWCEEARGAIKPIAPPKHTQDALLTVYPMGDPHFGMYAWAAECGDNFDLEIAERDLVGAVDHLVGQSPESERGVLVNLGDFFHYDNMDGVTARSGHALDTDGRLQKMIDVGVRALRRCIHRMLEKHQTVEVINAPGNHDHVLALAMNVLFRNVYENEPRVIVHNEPSMRHYVEHGKCLIGVVHGHQTKDRDLPGIMATEKAESWGRTRHRYFYRGHHHHDSQDDFNGCKVEQFRTLAAGDAYAVGAGYLSGRDMKAIVMHKDFGEVARFTCGIALLRAA